MVNTKADPVGLDKAIQSIQEDVFLYMLNALNIPNTEYESYGRCYKNQSKDDTGLVAEVFTGKGEYKDTLMDDQYALTSFFTAADTQDIDMVQGNTTNVGLIFMANLTRLTSLYPPVPGFALKPRTDEELHNLIRRYFQAPILGATATGLVTGMSNVFTEFTAWRNNKSIKYRDMHPWHCFRINFELKFSNSNC